jgi:hypothetical protein
MPSVVGNLKNRRIWFRLAWEKSQTTFQNNQNEKDWRHGSSAREPALQAQCLKFKLQ